MNRRPTSKALPLVLALLSAGPVFAQPAPSSKLTATQMIKSQLHPFYAARENSAPASVKQKLTDLRSLLASQKSDFVVGYTGAMDHPLSQLAGGRPGADAQARAQKASLRGAEMYKLDQVALVDFKRLNPHIVIPVAPPCGAGLPAFDYRRLGKVTPVKDQWSCGSCWDFAAVGALESSYLIRNNKTIDVSEQQILSCAHVGTCGGSWYDGVFDDMITHGAAAEADYPYVGSDAACKGAVPMPYRAVAHGVVHPEVGIPTPAQIKEALCQYGPLAVGVQATPLFQASAGNSVLQESLPLTVKGADGKTYYNTNHCVLIVGWDDSKQAWLVKNSWGTNWGSDCGFGTERGYIWIKYGHNNIGVLPGWVIARSEHYFPNFEQMKKHYPLIVPLEKQLITKSAVNQKVIKK
jgi:cathepsin L